MASSSRTNRFRRYLLHLAIAVSLSGCTIPHTAVSDPGVLRQKKVVFIYGIEDRLKIKETVRN